MTRLQKKCLVAVVGTHLLLVVALLCSGFVFSNPTPDTTEVLTAIPSRAVDAALSSGVRDAVPPPPTPVVPPQPPQPPQPQPPAVQPKPIEPPKPQETTPPPEIKPADLPEPKPAKPHTIDVDLKPVVHKATPQDNSAAEAEKAERQAAKAAKLAREARARAIRNALNNIKENASSATTVELPGDSSVAYANYASIVKTVYTDAWILPNNTSSDTANVKVSVTIANDGRVVESHIVDPSGDGSVDSSVQRTLDRVTDIAPFPDGATEKQRTYIINFNLKAKRMLG